MSMNCSFSRLLIQKPSRVVYEEGELGDSGSFPRPKVFWRLPQVLSRIASGFSAIGACAFGFAAPKIRAYSVIKRQRRRVRCLLGFQAWGANVNAHRNVCCDTHRGFSIVGLSDTLIRRAKRWAKPACSCSWCFSIPATRTFAFSSTSLAWHSSRFLSRSVWSHLYNTSGEADQII